MRGRDFVGKDVIVKFANPDHDCREWRVHAAMTYRGLLYYWMTGRNTAHGGQYIGEPESVCEDEIANIKEDSDADM